jgi:RNA polymerase sigma-70 factor (ECF subfamily)
MKLQKQAAAVPDHVNAVGYAEDSLPTTVEQVFYAYAGRVYSIAHRMLGHDVDAEDVTQDVLLQVVRKLHTFRGKACLTTWLHRITVNAALMHRRKRSRRRELPFDAQLEDSSVGASTAQASCQSPSPEQQILDNETWELVEQAIADLPEIYRDVYVLSDVENLPNGEIAEMLDLGIPAVKSRLHRARLFIREALHRHF